MVVEVEAEVVLTVAQVVRVVVVRGGDLKSVLWFKSPFFNTIPYKAATQSRFGRKVR